MYNFVLVFLSVQIAVVPIDGTTWKIMVRLQAR